jgi:BMFP domain-containing protein YqiC
MSLQPGTDSAAPFASRRWPISRRRFLRGSAVAMALPFLESMRAPFSRSAEGPGPIAPRRMFCICNNLGVLPKPFFPEGTGRDYTLSPYLKHLEDHRADFTVLSGVSHPFVDGGHPSDICFLTAAPHPASSSFRNSISLDQLVAEKIGTLTRFPSLTLAVNGGRSLSWTRTGVAIPPEGRASAVFNQLFLQGTPAEVERQVREIDAGRSILDVVSEQTRALERNVGARDRARLDQYCTSVRDLEHRLQESRGWAEKPKPRITVSPPVDPTSPAQYMAKVQVMYDLARLAFETDSTRAITLMLNSVGTPVVQIGGATITDSYHNLSHHGMAEDKLAQLKAIDERHMKLLARLFRSLKSAREGDARLLDRTVVLYGSNLGDANAHSTTNLPTLVAGGGFRHGQHLAFDRGRNYPLPNLFVSMLQRMGIEETGFGPSTGTMTGLETI